MTTMYGTEMAPGLKFLSEILGLLGPISNTPARVAHELCSCSKRAARNSWGLETFIWIFEQECYFKKYHGFAGWKHRSISEL